MSDASKPTRRGFTIVEILVVIAIITVLVSLLLPLMTTTKDLANTLNCASKLRNIGVAEHGFCSDNNGVFPTTGAWSERPDNWVFWEPGRNLDQSALQPYMGVKGATLKNMFICPSQPLEDQLGFQNGGAYTLTYSMNYSVSCYYPLKLQTVKNPQQKVLVYDENQYADDDQFWYGTDRDTLAARHGAVSYQAANIDGAGETHFDRGYGNVLFVDGHVALADNNFCHNGTYNDLSQN